MSRSTKLLFLSLGILQLGNGLHVTTFVSYAGFFFRDRFALSVTEVSILVSAAVLVASLTQFLACLLLDLGVRLAGRRLMLLRAPAIYVLGWLLMTFGPTPSLAALGGGLIGLG